MAGRLVGTEENEDLVRGTDKKYGHHDRKMSTTCARYPALSSLAHGVDFTKGECGRSRQCRTSNMIGKLLPTPRHAGLSS